MSPDKKKKATKAYKKDRKTIIMKTLNLNEDEYKQVMATGALLCRYTDLVQNGARKREVTPQNDEVFIGSLLSIFSIYGSMSLNPMEAVLYALSKSLLALPSKKEENDNTTK